jgi:hypothetical protein
MADVDAAAGEIADRPVGEHVVADLGQHQHRCAKPGGGDRLIGALPTVIHLEAGRFERFAARRHARDIGHEVDVIAADHRDPRLDWRVHRRRSSTAPMSAQAGAARRTVAARISPLRIPTLSRKT